MSNKFVSPTHPINDTAIIGARNAGKSLRWQMRYYCKIKRQNIYKQLGLLYEEGSQSNLKEALLKAQKIHNDLTLAVKTTGNALTSKTLADIIEEFLQDVLVKADENEKRLSEKLTPIHYIPKGQGDSFWRKTTINYYKPLFRDSLMPFFNEVGVLNKKTLDIDLWDVEDYQVWVNQNQPEKSPTYISYGIAAIRQIFGYGYRYVNSEGKRAPLFKGIPSPNRPKRQLKQRARRNLKQDEYNLILSKVDEICNTLKKQYEENKSPFYKDRFDKYYQFWLFLRMITWCGYRPFGGEVEHTVLKMNDFRIEYKGTDREQRFIRRQEKNKDYLAPLLPEAFEFHDALLKFHEANGNVYDAKTDTWSLTPYAFFHTGNYKNRYSRGDKIKNFREIWNRVIKMCGIRNPKGVPASERLVPYSLRGYFITMRLRNSNVDIGKLSKSVGTSTRMIEQTYYDFIVSAEWKELTETNIDVALRRSSPVTYL